jgi:hypothetical protein
LAIIIAAGCSSPSSSTGTGGGTVCAPQIGSYLVHFVERTGGTCGAVPDRIAAFNEGPNAMSMLAPGCTGQDQESSTCIETLSVMCFDPMSGITSNISGDLHFSADASTGHGVWQVDIRDKAGMSCSSIYDLTVTRQ